MTNQSTVNTARCTFYTLSPDAAEAALQDIAVQDERLVFHSDMARIMKVMRVSPIVFQEGGVDIVARNIQAAVVGWEDASGVREKWGAVISKDMHVDDICVVYKPDAYIDTNHPALAFMRKRSPVVKMSRFKGAASEVLAMPVEVMLPGIAVEVGQDVTVAAGVLKYEKPIPAEMREYASGFFPSDVSKPDEVRWQQAREITAAMVGRRCYATVKADGTAQTILWRTKRRGEESQGIHGYGRRYEMKRNTNIMPWTFVEAYGLENALASLGQEIAIQFEAVGPGLGGRHKNPMGLAQREMRVFTIYDIANARRLSAAETQSLCADLGIPMVEIAQVSKYIWVMDGSMTPAEYEALPQDRRTFPFWDVTLKKAWLDNPEVMRVMAEGLYANTHHQREGVVIRLMSGERITSGQWGSFKNINLRYK